MNHHIARVIGLLIYYLPILLYTTPSTLNSATPPNPSVSNFSSKLPVIQILAKERIRDEDRIQATLKVYENPPGTTLPLQHITPENLNISIELKGSTSAGFDKKSYRFETWGVDQQDTNVGLLGLPKENDWVLYGPYSDKSLIRNALAHYLGSKMKPYSIRTRFCEVFLNQEYEGVYLLMEVAKRDKHRIDISKLKAEDTTGTELTGGYVLMLDKIDKAKPQNIFTSSHNAKYIIKYPKVSAITPQQNNYIRSFLEKFEETISLPDYEDLLQGYPSQIDIPSFAALVLMNELSKDVDGYLFSTYLYKDKDSKNGKLHTGPFWDFNLAFGNADYRDGYAPEGWQLPSFHKLINEGKPVPEHMNFWWNSLWMSPLFQRQLVRQWHEYRHDFLNIEHINAYIDSLYLLLDEAQERNFSKHKVLGEPLWPNYFVGLTWKEEVDWLKDWIADRIQWMDSHLTDIHPIQSFSYILTDMNDRVLDTLKNGFRFEIDSNSIPSFKIKVSSQDSIPKALIELNKATPDHQYYNDYSILINSSNLHFGHNYLQTTPIVSTDTTESKSIESLLYFYITPSDSNSFLFPEQSPSSSSSPSSQSEELSSSSSNDLSPIFTQENKAHTFKMMNHLQLWNEDFNFPEKTTKVSIYHLSGKLELTGNKTEDIQHHSFKPGIYLVYFE